MAERGPKETTSRRKIESQQPEPGVGVFIFDPSKTMRESAKRMAEFEEEITKEQEKKVGN